MAVSLVTDSLRAPEAHDPWSIKVRRRLSAVSSQAAAERAEAFAPFHPTARVRWDDQWFYVESNGIANHEMMTGITNWQQQIPVPQNYYGTNAWQLPLHPTPAATATPISRNNLLKGAYAIAVNGIPIFNLYNNQVCVTTARETARARDSELFYRQAWR